MMGAISRRVSVPLLLLFTATLRVLRSVFLRLTFILLSLPPSPDNTAIWLTHIATGHVPSLLLLLLSPSSVASSSPRSVAHLRG